MKSFSAERSEAEMRAVTAHVKQLAAEAKKEGG